MKKLKCLMPFLTLAFLAISAWATDVTVASYGIPWTGPTTDVQIRFFLVGDGSTTILRTPENQVFRTGTAATGTTNFKYDCTYSGGTLTIPAVTLPATTNAVGGGRIRYAAVFFRKTPNTAIQEWSGYTYFQMPTDALSTTWVAIKTWNDSVGTTIDLSKPYTRGESEARLASKAATADLAVTAAVTSPDGVACTPASDKPKSYLGKVYYCDSATNTYSVTVPATLAETQARTNNRSAITPFTLAAQRGKIRSATLSTLYTWTSTYPDGAAVEEGDTVFVTDSVQQRFERVGGRWLPTFLVFDVQRTGAIGDGSSHPLSEKFASLAAAQAVYAHAVALTDEIDWAAIAEATNRAYANGGAVRLSPRVDLPTTIYLVNRAIPVKFGVTYSGVGGGPNQAISGMKGVYVKGMGATYVFENNGTAMSGVHLRDFTIDLTDANVLGGIYLYGTSYSSVENVAFRFNATFSSARKYAVRVKGGAVGAYGLRFVGCSGYNGGVQGGDVTGFLFEDSGNNNHVEDCLFSGIDQPYVVDSTNAVEFKGAGGDTGMVATFTMQNNARINTMIGGRSEHGGQSVTLTRASNVVTVTNPAGWKYHVGQVFRVVTAVDSSFVSSPCSVPVIATVADATHFTYAQTGANATTTGYISAGTIYSFSDGSYNNFAEAIEQVAAPQAVIDANSLYSNFVKLSDNLGQFCSTDFVSIGNEGNKVWGKTLRVPGKAQFDGSIQVYADVAGVGIYHYPNQAERFYGYTGATNTHSYDFPRIEWRDQSAGFAVVGRNYNGNWFLKTLQIGTSGTAITQTVVYTPSLTPASVSANTSAEQTFTVTGLATTDKITINAPSLPAGVVIANVRVSAPDTLVIMFGNLTAGSLTPTSGTYQIIATRN